MSLMANWDRNGAELRITFQEIILFQDIERCLMCSRYVTRLFNFGVNEIVGILGDQLMIGLKFAV